MPLKDTKWRRQLNYYISSRFIDPTRTKLGRKKKPEILPKYFKRTAQKVIDIARSLDDNNNLTEENLNKVIATALMGLYTIVYRNAREAHQKAAIPSHPYSKTRGPGSL